MPVGKKDSSGAGAPSAGTGDSAARQRTPGPWEWDWRYDAERAEADCGVFTQGRSIGLGHAYAVARCPRYQTREQWEADARLIAAAPDLLAALTLVRMSAPYSQFADETKQIIVAALAKATS